MNWMMGPHVIEPIAGLKGGDDEFIHLYILTIKLDAADTIRHIRLPSQLTRREVKQLNVAVVIASYDAAGVGGVRIAK